MGSKVNRKTKVVLKEPAIRGRGRSTQKAVLSKSNQLRYQNFWFKSLLAALGAKVQYIWEVIVKMFRLPLHVSYCV